MMKGLGKVVLENGDCLYMLIKLPLCDGEYYNFTKAEGKRELSKLYPKAKAITVFGPQSKEYKFYMSFSKGEI